MQAFDDEAKDDHQEVDRPFRLAAKNLFLTYPHCDVACDALRLHLLGCFGVVNVVYMVIAQEQHADGTNHLHAAVVLASKTNIRDPHQLDVHGCHGNYQGARAMKQTIAYVKKGGEFIEHGECPAHLIDAENRKVILDRIKSMTTETEVTEFIFLAGLTRDFHVLIRFWQSTNHGSTIQPSFDIRDFNPPNDLLQCLNGLTTSRQALLLIGPPGWGKTQFLQAFYKDSICLRITHLDQLRQCTNKTEVIILDDVELGHLPRPTLLHLLDMRTNRAIHCRYSNAFLTSNSNLILISNSIQLALGKYEEDEAVLRRLQTFHLADPLYGA